LGYAVNSSAGAPLWFCQKKTTNWTRLITFQIVF